MSLRPTPDAYGNADRVSDPSYSFSGTSSSSYSQCWTFIDVFGQVKMKAAIYHTEHQSARF